MITIKHPIGKVNVGDVVVTTRISARRYGICGIVRHIGELKGCGIADSVWSEWGEIWDGRIAPYSLGGCLTYALIDEVEVVGTWDNNEND